MTESSCYSPRVRAWLLLLPPAGLAACRVLSSGVYEQDGGASAVDAALAYDLAVAAEVLDASLPIDVGEPPGVAGRPAIVGCADGTREGFRDVANWPDIAGCAGGFDQPGVVGTPDLLPVCNRIAGDTSTNPNGLGCTAADLCAPQWHICRDGVDVAAHSPTGDCESCVPAGEPRFFLVASGASSMGICSPEANETNDLHGCGGLGEPETPWCAPLSRRMDFSDCLATAGAWWCGDGSGTNGNLDEALLVTKPKPDMGGALCCKDLPDAHPG